MPRSCRRSTRYDLALVARRRDQPHRSAVALEPAIAGAGDRGNRQEAITVKIAVAGLKAFDIGAVETAVSYRVGNLPDDEAVASDVLGFLAGTGVPSAFEIEAVNKLLEILIPFIVANQAAHPINDPVRDAQTSETQEAAAHRKSVITPPELDRKGQRTEALHERTAPPSQGPFQSIRRCLSLKAMTVEIPDFRAAF